MFKLADSFFDKRKQDLQYARYFLAHKMGVAAAGIKLNLPATTIISHDWSKMRPGTWDAHRDYFYGSQGISGSNDRPTFLDYKASRVQHFLDEPGHHGFNKSIESELESVADWYAVHKANMEVSGLNFPNFKSWWIGGRAKFVHQLSPAAVEKIDNLLAMDIDFIKYLSS